MSGENLLALAFADQCRRWSRQLGAGPEAQQAAGRAGLALVQAEAGGHVCLGPEETAPDREALLASGVAGPPEQGQPLVLDGEGRLYLARNYAAEVRLARSLVRRHQDLPAPPGPAARALLRQLFAAAPPGDGQQLAVALALCRRLAVISGGPGTGKTTTVARLLACLLADAPDSRIALAAPTGKAAARLQESLAARAAELPPDIAARLPREAGTLHRLLGLGPEGEAPRHHGGNPLGLDVLVVDEASMLDLGLALQLCEALPAGTRLILLGDPHQLQAVEAGAVFAVLAGSAALAPAFRARLADLCGWAPEVLESTPWTAAPGPLGDAAVGLSRSHRFASDSPLGRLARALVAGQGREALACFAAGGELLHQESSGRSLDGAEYALLEAGYAPYRQALAAWHQGRHDPAPLFAAFEAFRVLCATRQGERGVEGVNNRLAAAFRGPGGASPTGLHAGLPLMIRRNDPGTRLFNGDIGLVLEDAQGLGAWFADGQGGYRRLSPGRLPAWEPAFAMTVHKSQGSEFDAVTLVLPERDSPLLSRELVYTAVTRARRQVRLLGRGDLLLQASARVVRREGGLGDRLAAFQAAALP